MYLKQRFYEHIDNGKFFCCSSDEAVNQIGSAGRHMMLWTPFMSRAYGAEVQPRTEQHDGYRVQHLRSKGQPVENHCMFHSLLHSSKPSHEMYLV